MKIWLWAVIAIIVVLVLGYLGRDYFLPAQTQDTTSAPSESSSASKVESEPDNVVWIKTDEKGAYLITTKEMTLYIFDRDTEGVSNCNTSCATTWPPYIADSIPEESQLPNMSTIKRADGSLQYAYKGMPLYLYINDKQSGDVKGDGVEGIWHLARL